MFYRGAIDFFVKLLDWISSVQFSRTLAIYFVIELTLACTLLWILADVIYLKTMNGYVW